MFRPSLRIRSWSLPSTRFARDVAASVVATGIGTVVWASLPPAPAGPSTTVPKTSARLSLADDSFVEEDVPVRRTRVYDSLAMFALPQAEPAPWSDRPAPVLASVEPARDAVPDRPRTMPRIVTAAAGTDGHPAVLPPTRPERLSARAASLEAAPPVRIATAGREPVRVLGWALPGTEYLPSGSEAAGAAAAFGQSVATAGGRAVDSVGGAATTVRHAVASAGSAVFETVGVD